MYCVEYIDPIINSFIQNNPIEKRKEIANAILLKYPEKVPIIIGRGELKNTPKISSYKFLVPRNIEFGRFIHEIRVQMPNLHPAAGLYLFPGNNKMISSTIHVGDVYNSNKADDGFLYITYAIEMTFG